jgi:hypothetical protein
MNMDLTPRPLAAIAADLRHEVEQADQQWQSAVGHAIRAGELLIEAKTQVEHGEWLPWLEANFPGSVRSAQGYMRIARNRAKYATVAHLGVGGALKQLTAPRKESEDDHLGKTQEYIARADADYAKAAALMFDAAVEIAAMTPAEWANECEASEVPARIRAMTPAQASADCAAVGRHLLATLHDELDAEVP